MFPPLHFELSRQTSPRDWRISFGSWVSPTRNHGNTKRFVRGEVLHMNSPVATVLLVASIAKPLNQSNKTLSVMILFQSKPAVRPTADDWPNAFAYCHTTLQTYYPSTSRRIQRPYSHLVAVITSLKIAGSHLQQASVSYTHLTLPTICSV